MIKPDQIPDEMVEEAGEAFLECDWVPSCSFDDAIRAAIAAALNAWPDSEIHNFDGTHFAEAIVLPLPEAPQGRIAKQPEASDD